MMKFLSKLGTAKGNERSRIWIEGDRLTIANFHVGEYFVDEPGGKTLHLYRLTADDVIAPGVTPRKISGKGKKPIIDLTGKWIFEMFGKEHTHVEVTYQPNHIMIKGLKND